MQAFKEVNLVLELGSFDMKQLIEMNQATLNTNHIRFLAYEVLKGLVYIHSRGIIHRDLRPVNVLVSKSLDVKICDFGHSVIKSSEVCTAQDAARKVTTKSYRAPEVQLEYSCGFDQAVDMWAFGCILAEFFLTRPLVPGAAKEATYLDFLLAYLGPPPDSVNSLIQNQNASLYLQRKAKRAEGKSLRDLMPGAPLLAVDLIQRLLTYDPRERLTARQAIDHPFFEGPYKDDQDVFLIQGGEVDPFDFEFENHPLSLDQLRQLITDEIIKSNCKEAKFYTDMQRRRFPAGDTLEKIFGLQKRDVQEAPPKHEGKEILVAPGEEERREDPRETQLEFSPYASQVTAVSATPFDDSRKSEAQYLTYRQQQENDNVIHLHFQINTANMLAGKRSKNDQKTEADEPSNPFMQCGSSYGHYDRSPNSSKLLSYNSQQKNAQSQLDHYPQAYSPVLSAEVKSPEGSLIEHLAPKLRERLSNRIATAFLPRSLAQAFSTPKKDS